MGKPFDGKFFDGTFSRKKVVCRAAATPRPGEPLEEAESEVGSASTSAMAEASSSSAVNRAGAPAARVPNDQTLVRRVSSVRNMKFQRAKPKVQSRRNWASARRAMARHQRSGSTRGAFGSVRR